MYGSLKCGNWELIDFQETQDLAGYKNINKTFNKPFKCFKMIQKTNNFTKSLYRNTLALKRIDFYVMLQIVTYRKTLLEIIEYNKLLMLILCAK